MAAKLHLLDQRRLIDTNGIADGASIYFYLTGTLTPATIYSEATLTTPMTNPVVVPAGAAVPNIYLDSEIIYRRRIVYTDGSVDDSDPYTGAAPSAEAVAAADARARVLPIPADYAGANFAAQFQAAVMALSAAGGGTLTVPPGDYTVNGNLLFPYGVSNITVMAYGATFRNARLSIQGGFGLGNARNITFFGGKLTQSSGLDADYLLDISGKDILIRDTVFRCEDASGNIVPKPGYVGFFRVDVANSVRAERVTLDNVTFDGSNGLLMAGRGHRIVRNRWTNASMYQDVFGGDDAVAIKAIGESSFDIEVSDCYFAGYAGFVSLGSEIGTRSADDPTFSIGVSDIRVLRNTGTACSSTVYIKLGAIGILTDVYDFRNGFADKIFVRDNVLEDLTGKRMLTPIAVHMGRGSKLRRLEMTNNTIRGRMLDDDNALNAVIQVMIRNLGSGATVEEIDIDGLHFIDPTGSAAPSGTNGFRPRFFLQTEREHTTGGSIGRIRMNNVTVNGTAGCAVYVGPNVTGPVELSGVDFTALSSNPPSGGFDAAIVDDAGVVKIEGTPRLAVTGSQIPIKAAATKNVAGRRETVMIGDVPPGSAIYFPWTAPCKCQVTNLYLMNGADNTLSGTNYRSFAFRRRSNGTNGTSFLNKNTLQGDSGATGNFVAGVPLKMNANMIQTVDAVFAQNDVLAVDFSGDTGASTTFTRLRVIVEYVPLDRPS